MINRAVSGNRRSWRSSCYTAGAHMCRLFSLLYGVAAPSLILFTRRRVISLFWQYSWLNVVVAAIQRGSSWRNAVNDDVGGMYDNCSAALLYRLRRSGRLSRSYGDGW